MENSQPEQQKGGGRYFAVNAGNTVLDKKFCPTLSEKSRKEWGLESKKRIFPGGGKRYPGRSLERAASTLLLCSLPENLLGKVVMHLGPVVQGLEVGAVQ